MSIRSLSVVLVGARGEVCGARAVRVRATATAHARAHAAPGAGRGRAHGGRPHAARAAVARPPAHARGEGARDHLPPVSVTTNAQAQTRTP